MSNYGNSDASGARLRKRKPSRDATSTGRIYLSAQRAFADWLEATGAGRKPGHEDVARYLAYCLERHGASTTRVHLSAIADLFRSDDRPLDTKARVIQEVVEKARQQMRDQMRNVSNKGKRRAFTSRLRPGPPGI